MRVQLEVRGDFLRMNIAVALRSFDGDVLRVEIVLPRMKRLHGFTTLGSNWRTAALFIVNQLSGFQIVAMRESRREGFHMAAEFVFDVEVVGVVN